MKPVELVERAVENSSQAGDTVLDPFAGAGTTLIACERLKRRALDRTGRPLRGFDLPEMGTI